MFGKSITTGKLLVTYAAAVADPTLITGGAATVETLGTAWQALSRQSPDLEALSKELNTAVMEGLKANAVSKADLPRFETMLQDAAAHMNFAAARLEPEPIRDAIRKGLTDAGYDTGEINTLARVLETPLGTLCNDPRLTAAIDPALRREQMRKQEETNAKLDAANAKLDALTNKSTSEKALSKNDIALLAYRFDIADPDAYQPQELLKLLTQRSEEMRNLKAELEELRQRFPQLDNVVAEALSLLEGDKVDTKAVRAMIKEARKSWHESMLRDALEKDAEFAVIEARTHLYENNPDEAFNILTAAADAFGVVDALDPARKRNAYANLLYDHGLRYGGTGLARAAEMLQRASEAAEGKDSTLWAGLQNNLAAALRNQAQRASGEKGAAFRARAIEAYEAALAVYTKSARPVQWATTQNNLANVLGDQALRVSGEESTVLFARAVDAYEAALTVRTKDAHPVDWAATQNNLAAALSEQALRTSGEGGAALLARAVKAFEAALTIRTKAEHPQHFAETQENLAELHYAWAHHDSCAAPRAHLDAALYHVDTALEVYDPVHSSYYHEKATRLRELIRAALEA